MMAGLELPEISWEPKGTPAMPPQEIAGLIKGNQCHPKK